MNVSDVSLRERAKLLSFYQTRYRLHFLLSRRKRILLQKLITIDNIVVRTTRKLLTNNIQKIFSKYNVLPYERVLFLKLNWQCGQHLKGLKPSFCVLL